MDRTFQCDEIVPEACIWWHNKVTCDEKAPRSVSQITNKFRLRIEGLSSPVLMSLTHEDTLNEKHLMFMIADDSAHMQFVDGQ